MRPLYENAGIIPAINAAKNKNPYKYLSDFSSTDSITKYPVIKINMLVNINHTIYILLYG